jgi:hypothetical protein
MRIKEILNLTITFARREKKSQHRGELSSMFVNILLTLSAFGFVRVFERNSGWWSIACQVVE